MTGSDDLVAPGPNSARFHFDPLHDASHVPSERSIRQWLEDRVQVVDSAMFHVVGMKETITSNSSTLTRGWEGIRRWLGRALGHHGTTEDRHMAAATKAAIAMLETMREFAVDPTTHPTLSLPFEKVAAMAAIGVTEADCRRDIARMRRRGSDSFIETMDSVMERLDTERSLVETTAGIRASLEIEAMTNLLTNPHLTGDRARMIAALRASLSELLLVDVREGISAILAGIEGDHNP